MATSVMSQNSHSNITTGDTPVDLLVAQILIDLYQIETNLVDWTRFCIAFASALVSFIIL